MRDFFILKINILFFLDNKLITLNSQMILV
jgi:hypothetical protein